MILYIKISVCDGNLKEKNLIDEKKIIFYFYFFLIDIKNKIICEDIYIMYIIKIYIIKIYTLMYIIKIF